MTRANRATTRNSLFPSFLFLVNRVPIGCRTRPFLEEDRRLRPIGGSQLPVSTYRVRTITEFHSRMRRFESSPYSAPRRLLFLHARRLLDPRDDADGGKGDARGAEAAHPG